MDFVGYYAYASLRGLALSIKKLDIVHRSLQTLLDISDQTSCVICSFQMLKVSLGMLPGMTRVAYLALNPSFRASTVQTFRFCADFRRKQLCQETSQRRAPISACELPILAKCMSYILACGDSGQQVFIRKCLQVTSQQLLILSPFNLKGQYGPSGRGNLAVGRSPC